MTQPAQQPDKDLDTIRDFIVMASDWEAQQDMALDALHRIRSRPAPSPQHGPDKDTRIYFSYQGLEDRDKRRDTTIRNATLDEILSFAELHKNHDNKCSIGLLKRKAESLRTNQEPHP